MTVPTIVITVEGGCVQDIAVSHQARVIVLDYDTEGADPSEVLQILGVPTYVTTWGNPCLPDDSSGAYLSEVLADIEKASQP